MRIDPRQLVQKLTPKASRALEGGVGYGVQAGHGTISPEHVLVTMLRDEQNEVRIVLSHLQISVDQVLRELETELTSQRSIPGNRPVLSDGLVLWMQDAWLLSSLTWKETQLRSAALFVQWLRDPARYGGRSLRCMQGVQAELIAFEVPQIVAGSDEAQSAAGDSSAPAGSNAPVQQSVLSQYGECFTENARNDKYDPVLGRENEIRQVIDVLSRRRKNNVVIVGEPGVGKTALVEGLARAIVRGEVPEPLRNVELWGLDLGLLQAGASVKGEFEARLEKVLREVKTSAKPILLFIDEAHMLLGAGGAQGTGDAANLLKPALARGELRTLAATTWKEYKKYFEKDAALERRFQVVKVDEPTVDGATAILRGLRPILERAHDVVIRDEAVVAAAELSARYITGRQLPDKSVDLLDTTAARARVDRSSVPSKLSALESDIASTKREHEALARDIEDGEALDQKSRLESLGRRLQELEETRQALATRWSEQQALLLELVKARKELASLTADSSNDQKVKFEADVARAIEKLRAIDGAELLVTIDVDADAVSKTIESWTGIPAGRMKRRTADAMLVLEDRLGQQIRGQNLAISSLASGLRIGQLGLTPPDAPRGVFLFVGPSGVGKTETARLVAEELFGGERFMTKVHMSEYQEKHSVSRLIGSPPGYVGYGEGGFLTEAVRQKPYSVVLLDECEKADLEVLNLFYQVFDKGELNDGEGRKVSFKNTVIILTSNLASEDIIALHEQNPEGLSSEDIATVIRPKLAKFFKPALLNRMTVVPFAPLDKDALVQIAAREIAAIKNRVETQHGVRLEVAESVVDGVIRRCHHVDAGARDLRQVLNQNLTPLLSRKLLEGLAGGSMPSSLQASFSDEAGFVVE